MMIEKRKAPAFHCPRWEELPDMDLYMDQVVTLLNEYLKPFHAKDQEKMVTSTMINNYVKHGIVSPPVKKKYTKNHVAYLMVVCILKMVYRMDEISKLIRVQIYKYPIDQAYNYFCAELECCLKCIFAHKKVHHAPSDDEGSLVVDLIRNTVQAVAYTILCTARAGASPDYDTGGIRYIGGFHSNMWKLFSFLFISFHQPHIV